MIVFHSDLDNTLIYSYKHDIGEKKKCVEIYEGREISFMTDTSYRLLKEVVDQVMFVPTTTRTLEQYERIDLGAGKPKYALICNGGVLLKDGKEDATWYQESVRLVSCCFEELEKGKQILETDVNRSFEVRNIRGLFLFTKSEEPETSVQALREVLDMTMVDVFCNGVKVYVVPKNLSKGMALARFRRTVKAERVVAAGDSEFDVSMLREADAAIAPEDLIHIFEIAEQERIAVVRRGEIFSDCVLQKILGI